jgi:DNA-binding PadR family transcriptional regulator
MQQHTAPTEQEIAEALSELIEAGLVEPAGVNEKGEITYQITEAGIKATEVLLADNN